MVKNVLFIKDCSKNVLGLGKNIGLKYSMFRNKLGLKYSMFRKKLGLKCSTFRDKLGLKMSYVWRQTKAKNAIQRGTNYG